MQAILLAGGRGERLRPYTYDRPKPMVKVSGVPLIAYGLGWLKENGITDVVLSCGHRWQALYDYLGDGSRYGLNVQYAVENEKLGRGGGIRFAMQYLDSAQERFVVANGDNVVDIDLRAVLAEHAREQAAVTIVLTPFISSRGIVEVDGRGRVTRFVEKPELPHWINAGIYVFERQVADLLPERGDHEDTLLPQLAVEGRLHGYLTREMWRTVDTAKDIAAIGREIEAGLHVPCLT